MMQQLLEEKPLFVFALEIEAEKLFPAEETIFVGVGKVNAAYELTKRIMKQRPSIIVNLGSAGSAYYKREEVINCSHFVQRDMDASSIGCRKYETPFGKTGSVLKYGFEVDFLPQGVCGTGDSFEMNHSSDTYNLVDMEAYALAYVAQKEKIPFLCLKYISDGADGSAANEWNTMVLKAAKKLKNTIDLIKEQK